MKGQRCGREIDARDCQVAVQAFAQPLSIARRESDEELKMRTLAEGANVDMLHMNPDKSLERNVLIPRAVMHSREVVTSLE